MEFGKKEHLTVRRTQQEATKSQCRMVNKAVICNKKRGGVVQVATFKTDEHCTLMAVIMRGWKHT